MIIGKTPLRISFFGGGTDIPSFFEKEFGCVINAAIDKFIYLVMHESFDEKNLLAYSKLEKVSSVDEIENTRIREAIKKVGNLGPVEVHSIGEVPSGTGLGSSSSFTVGLLNLFYNSQGRFVSKEVLAKQACEIEIGLLNEPIGKQDQYAAAFGGLNYIQFNKDNSVDIEPIKLSNELQKKLNERLVIFYLGRTGDASDILSEQKERINSDSKKFENLRNIKEITLKMKEDLTNNRLDNFGEMLHKSWLLKKSLVNRISDKYIDKIYEKGINAGAKGGKVLGAGGRGFILFYCEPENQDTLRMSLKNLREFKVQIEKEGTKIIYSQ